MTYQPGDIVEDPAGDTGVVASVSDKGRVIVTYTGSSAWHQSSLKPADPDVAAFPQYKNLARLMKETAQ